jgi:dolichol kinase
MATIMSDFTIVFQDMLSIIVAIFFMVCSIIVPKKLQQKNLVSKYVARKMIHSFGGLTIIFALFLSIYTLILGEVLFIIFTILIWYSTPDSHTKLFREIFNAVSEDDEIKLKHLQGPFLYALSITIIFGIYVFFRELLYFPISGIIIMMYADTLASVVGKKIGKHKIKLRWMQNYRSLEGSLTFLITAFVCSFCVFYLFGVQFYTVSSLTQIMIDDCIKISVIMSVITTILELLSPSKFDDLIITVGGTIISNIIAFYLIF